MMLTVVLPSMLMILLSTLSVIRHLICDNNQSWILNLNLTHETLYARGRKWFADFNAGKTQFVLFLFQSNNSGAIDVNFKMLGLSLSSTFDRSSYIIYSAETASKKIGTLIRSMRVLSPRLLFISINLPYGLSQNTVVMSWLVLPAATCICQVSYRNKYAGLLVQHLLPLLNPWLIVEMQPAKVFPRGMTLVDVHLN